MRLAHATLYRRLLARDPLYDGRFFTGVLTTGIYCLPSCRAKRPLAKNVRFYPSCEAARSAGLRACKKCHPDDYATGSDPVQETIERVVAEVRADPATFTDAAAVVARTGYGTTRAFELFRHHYHRTPAELLGEARLARAQQLLLTTSQPLASLASAAGYESLSTLHESFRTQAALTPTAYRALRRAGARLRFSLRLPADFSVAGVLRSLGRDAQSLSEQVHGSKRYVAAVRLGGAPARLVISFEAVGLAEVCIERVNTEKSSRAPLDSGAGLGALAHRYTLGLLGLHHDTASFAARWRKLGLGGGLLGPETLRLPRTWDAWESLVWAILGQQIKLAFTFRLRRALTEVAGSPVGEGLVAVPDAATVVGLSPSTLEARQFSRQKIATLQRVARLVVDRSLDLDAWPDFSATRIARLLGDVPGLGPWTVNYVMMRGLGWPDCVPYRDTGVTSGLQRLFALDHRPDEEETRRLMLPFSPHRSLATATLWNLPPH